MNRLLTGFNGKMQCLADAGNTLQPPCRDAQCACDRAAELEDFANNCVKAKCPGELMGEFTYTANTQT